MICGCSRVGANPWMGMDYTEADCGTDKAILTITGCVTSPSAGSRSGVAVNSPNDVGKTAAPPPDNVHNSVPNAHGNNNAH